MGSDLRIVDVGIKVFQFKFSSSFQMEWLPNFCFICGVLVMVRNIILGFKVSLNVTGFLGTELEKTVALRGFLRNIELLAAVGRRKERKKTLVYSIVRWLLVR